MGSHLADKPEASSPYRPDHTLFAAAIADGLAQGADSDGNRRIADGTAVPYCIDQFVLGHQTGVVGEQELQN